MKVVVADTSPLNYLILIGQIQILQQLYGSILVPDQVFAELRHLEAPAAVNKWTRNPPSWMRIEMVRSNEASSNLLGAGEQAAIRLAQSQVGPVLLLVDDADARSEALRLGIPVSGTLGVLRAAGLRGFLDLRAAFYSLRQTSFRCSPKLLDDVLSEFESERNPRDE